MFYKLLGRELLYYRILKKKKTFRTVINKKCSSFGIYSYLILLQYEKLCPELGIYLSAV